MEKFVYLFELDSVRNTDREIELGQKALFNEIISNGNVVVLTYNQLVDSRGFFSLLDIEDYYKNFIALFERGAIRISQYGDIRTITQYLINAFDYEKEFIFSGWPLQSTQKRLLALIKRSLTYNDLSEIYGFFSGKREDEELLDLFVELKNGQEMPTKFSPQKCREILENLYWLLKMVLRISSLHTIYIPPRDEAEYSHLRMKNILEIVLSLNPPEEFKNLWQKSLEIIRNLPCYGGNNRSDYLNCLREEARDKNSQEKEFFQLAEAIINLCYNYACEISICNISKHYNADELSESGEKPSFTNDFFGRLNQDWNMGSRNDRFLKEESNEFIEFVDKKKLSDLSVAVRISSYAERKNDENEKIARYEKNINAQKKNQKIKVLKAVFRRTILLFICILIAAVLEIIFNKIENLVDDFINFDTLFWRLVKALLSLAITEGITSILATKFKWLVSFSEALGEIGKLFADFFRINFNNYDTYLSFAQNNNYEDENKNKGLDINLIKSNALKKYQAFKNQNSTYFNNSEIYPLADVGDYEVVKNLNRLEEIYGYKFGLVYKSNYNLLVIDPILDKEGNLFPYERLIPAKENSVVMMTKMRDKFILLRQYRHAIRDFQISFPRGYGELGINPLENAKKELLEELGAKISNPPTLLGRICPDSGLTNSCPYVFLVEIDDYENKQDEGIIEIVELSEEEFLSIKTNDAFTMGAYWLYRQLEVRS